MGSLLLLGVPLAAQAVEPPPVQLQQVDVVATTPIPGLNQKRDEIPVPVRSLDPAALADRNSSLPKLLGDHLPSVNVNEIQGNPFQADINFRGFTASPLLGTPQGLSVYQDGVRINEPFGDIVNWDLVPRAAIAGLDLIAGANPLFGLNTLGGAIAIRTKSGLQNPGTAFEASAGSFGRQSLEFESGSKRDDLGFYAAGTWFHEKGWRDFSPSDVKQAFVKLSRQTASFDLDLSLTHADTDLIGNALLPASMLRQRRESIFTQPDNTINRMTMLAFSGAYWLTADTRLSASAYLRQNLTRTLNGDVNDQFEGGANDGDAGANGGLGFDTDTAANNRTRTRQRGYGGGLQWSLLGERGQTAVGLTIDQSRASFTQSVETGTFNADRGLTGGGSETVENSIDGRTRNYGLYAMHSFQPLSGVVATLSGRFNQAHVQSIDQLNPGVANNLDGDFVYRKFNPSAGVTWAATPAVSFYASAGQGNRAPSPIELGCANPANPCSLPNAMQSDPYLKQVVTRSLEAGIRGRAGEIEWNAGVYAARNYDDILFVGTSTSAGFFTNFGKTQRQGAEISASGRAGRLGWRANYGFVRASFRSNACLLSPNNSSRGQSTECTGGGQDDEILVSAGNRMPGIPEHSLKLGLDWRASDAWTLTADALAYSRQYVRGNENNRHQSGAATDAFGNTRTFNDSGVVPAYGVLNLGLRGNLGGGWEAFAQLNNVFDKRYATAGALAENPFDAGGAFQTNSADWARETFYAPGAPRAAWIGARYLIGGH